jgi:hypothetical protein
MLNTTVVLHTFNLNIDTDDRLMVVPYSIGGVGLVVDNPDGTERLVLRFETVHADALHSLWVELKRQTDQLDAAKAVKAVA